MIRKSLAKGSLMYIPLAGSAEVKLADNSKVFTDVAAGAWYAGAARFAGARELFAGVGPSQFGPTESLSRAMLVTVLRRLENGDGDGAGAGFADVAPGAWYAGSVAWANAAGIIGGVSDTDFAPTRAITREELASILYRYARYLGSDLVGATGAEAGAETGAEAGAEAGAATGSETGGGAAGASAGSATNPAASAADPLAGFADRADVSAWATEVTRWAVETGLLAGRAGKDGVVLLAPKSEVTRAEAAVILRRLLERLI